MSLLASRLRPLALAAFALLLLAWGLLTAVQGGWLPSLPPNQSLSSLQPQIQGKIAAVLYITLSSSFLFLNFWGSAFGLGWLIQPQLLPNYPNRILLRLALGTATLLLLIWSLGSLGLLNRWTAWALSTFSLGIIVWRLTTRPRQSALDIDRWPTPPWPLLLAMPLLGLWLTAISCPPGTLWAVEAFAYDVQTYHLQLPREWFALHQITPLQHNVYSYLPNLMEACYLWLAYLNNSPDSTLYAAQLIHASMAGLTAVAIAAILYPHTGKTAAGLAAILFLSTPWVLIVSTNAYNEMTALALATTAWLILLSPPTTIPPTTIPSTTLTKTPHSSSPPPIRHPSPTTLYLIAGCLLGTATLAKLTVGLMMLPLPLLLLLFPRFRPSFSTSPLRSTPRLKPILYLLAGLFLILSPYLLRNFLLTSNPIFPIATSFAGHAHWSPDQALRWQLAHHSPASLSTSWSNLYHHLWQNIGYNNLPLPFSSSSNSPATAPANDITLFHRPPGIPLLWSIALLSLFHLLRSKSSRPLTLLLTLQTLCILTLWFTLTHQQARFLLPILPPVCILISLAWKQIHSHLKPSRHHLPTAFALLLLSASVWNCFDIFWHQTRTISLPTGPFQQPPYFLIDSLPAQPDPLLLQQYGAGAGDHILNYLPPDSKTLIIAQSAVLYIRRPITYQTPFDTDPLGQIIRTKKTKNPTLLLSQLKSQGFTHIWINWAELSRLQATYGYDPDLDTPTLTQLAQQSRILYHYGWATLLAIP